APKFIPSQISSLKRYFDDLEKHFTAAENDGSAQNDEQKKNWAVYYLDSDTRLLWERLPKYTAQTGTYNDFKTEVLSYYPGSDPNALGTYTAADLNALVLQYQAQGGVTTKEALGHLRRQLFFLTTILTANDQITKSDTTRAFMSVFHPVLQDMIRSWIERKEANYLPGGPVELSKLFDAAEWALSGGVSADSKMMEQLNRRFDNLPRNTPPRWQNNDNNRGMGDFYRGNDNQHNNYGRSGGNTYYGSGPPRQSNSFNQSSWQNDDCMYCGTRGCRIGRCLIAEQDIREGLVYPLPDDVIVAVSSEAIRAVRPLVAGRSTVDAVLDPGCSIVCMSDQVARELALMFDPNVTLKMQSANGTID
ncbi:hypothetical protein DL96DRAFT_1423509, partial [Flagelloscypha sp. PMI_526]